MRRGSPQEGPTPEGEDETDVLVLCRTSLKSAREEIYTKSVPSG